MSLAAFPHRRVVTAQAALGDVELAVRAERQPARIVQASALNRDSLRGMVLGVLASICLGDSREPQETGE
jgi:hypothetical protein